MDTQVKVVEHTDASQLPGPTWLWRRVYTFVLTAVLCALVWRITEQVTDVGTLRMVASYSLGIIALLVFVYVAGATATDVVALVQAAKTTRRETTTTATPPATITAGNTKIEADTPEDAPWARSAQL